ncbi:uncharacterized protein PV07_08604 [Cladophialophora immunda]|uniref:Uncharacterized protein n=1 Tax=Cladophialophora immunda TaxID=569365 RepID=A0A0D1ZCH1_9EURO|nr:uncharacterized protein PV07_08604 [Cladophialophora immunda]KIW25431.1 hypothetical protein PV07_08604 [Cladophialophora immunda]
MRFWIYLQRLAKSFRPTSEAGMQSGRGGKQKHAEKKGGALDKGRRSRMDRLLTPLMVGGQGHTLSRCYCGDVRQERCCLMVHGDAGVSTRVHSRNTGSVSRYSRELYCYYTRLLTQLNSPMTSSFADRQ